MNPEEIAELPMLCGRSIQGNPRYFPQAEYQERTIYFCTEFCRRAFESASDRFYVAHRRRLVSEEE